MKKVLILILVLGIQFLYSCAGEEDCSVSGCDNGFHCNTEEKCEENCSDAYCETIGLSCNHDTKVCEKKPCTETGCEDNYICDTETQSCKPDTSCKVLGCKTNFVCNLEKLECEAACIKNVCDDYFLCNEDLGTCYPACGTTGCQADYVCDEATQLCQADESCKTVPCNDNYLCDENLGTCYPACTTTGCQADYICDEETQLCNPDTSCRTQGCEAGYNCNASSGLCEHIACTYNSCSDDLICNVNNGLCEAATEYPTGDGVVTNRIWTDQNGKVVSLKFLYNKYIKTGYPKAILLGHSAGWCPYCRRETPHLQAKYDSSKTGEYYKLAVLQELCEANSQGQVATQSFIDGWVSQYNLIFPVAIGDQLHHFRSGIHPFMVIIDPKTMKVVTIGTPTWEYTEAEVNDFMDLHIDPLYTRN